MCGMDEFRVDVIDVHEEAEHLEQAGKAALKPKDMNGDDEEGVLVGSVPCSIVVSIKFASHKISRSVH